MACAARAGRETMAKLRPGPLRVHRLVIQRDAACVSARGDIFRDLLEPGAVPAHRGALEVAVRALAHGRHALEVVGAREALAVADDVARADAEAGLEAAREGERGGELGRSAHDVRVGHAD